MTLESRKKLSLAHQGQQMGKNNPFFGKHHSPEVRAKSILNFKKRWEGHIAITPQNQIDRRRFQQTIQKQVFERDNYTCQICGQRGGYLQVDHIQSWADYVKLRFSMDNCRTLCMSCHYKITFGREMPKEIKKWGHNFKYSERMVS